jgi:hypothetical protein
LLLMLLLPACARWSGEKAAESSNFLPTPQKSPDSVVVETVLVRFDKGEIDRLSNIWQHADESVLDLQLRQRLDQNGLRCGVILGEIPKLIREQMQRTAEDQKSDALEHAGLAADVDSKMRRMQCRAGRRKEVVVRTQVSEALTTLCVRDGKVQGQTFEKPTVLYGMRVIPHGDQQSTVELIPEIEHGELKHSFVSSDFGVRPEMRRPRQSWEELAIEIKLRPGQILLLASTLPPKALGSAFFTTKTAEGNHEHVIMLLRVAENQLDDLFTTEQSTPTRSTMLR